MIHIFNTQLFSYCYLSKRRRGWLVNWIEKAGLENIRRLMEIIEVERNHELLLTARNLRELAVYAFSYIILVIPLSLLTELIKGEHFVLADLCKSNPGGSSKEVAQEDQAEAAIGALVRSIRIIQPQSLRPAPRPEKNEQDRKRVWKTKVVGTELEDFMDWTGILVNEPVEEEEVPMLVVGFAAHMRKWVADSEDESTPISDGKCPPPYPMRSIQGCLRQMKRPRKTRQ